MCPSWPHIAGRMTFGEYDLSTFRNNHKIQHNPESSKSIWLVCVFFQTQKLDLTLSGPCWSGRTRTRLPFDFPRSLGSSIRRALALAPNKIDLLQWRRTGSPWWEGDVDAVFTWDWRWIGKYFYVPWTVETEKVLQHISNLWGLKQLLNMINDMC